MYLFLCLCLFVDNPKKKKKSYKVLKLSELKYYRNKINSILCLSLFVDNPKKKKINKVTTYSSLVSLSTVEIK